MSPRGATAKHAVLPAADRRFARILALVPYALAHPGIHVDELAAMLGATPEEITDDVKLLWYCGLPGQGSGDLIELDYDALEEDGTVYLSNADYLQCPLRLNRDEALALVLALTYLRDVAPGESRKAVDSALTKLTAAIGTGELASTATIRGGRPTVREGLVSALGGHRRVRLVYDAPDRTSIIEVEPREIFVREGVLYLRAFSLERDAWRVYRVDRIAELTVLDELVAERPEPPADLWSGLGEAVPVTLDLAPCARWLPEYVPTQIIEQTDGRLRVTLGVLDPGWLRQLLLRLGPAVLAVDPPSAQESARAAAAAALARYDLVQNR